jgi:dCMP deaminase
MRPNWNEYFMLIAREVAKRATCDRKHVGAVIISPDRHILATGYNGSIPGTPHCDDAGHMLIFDPNTNRESCVRTVHAEANAIVQAAKNGSSIDGGIIYTTASPCWPCFKLIASSGIKRIVYGELYKDDRITQFANEAGIELIKM